MTTLTEEEQFWMSVINANTKYKNPNTSDKERIHNIKERIQEEKEREKRMHHLATEEVKKFVGDGSVIAMAMRDRVKRYLSCLTPKDHVTMPIIIGVFWRGRMPPRSAVENREFDIHCRTMIKIVNSLNKK